MPVNIMVGLLALLVALVTYSIAAIGAFRAKQFKPRHLVLLWVGFVLDVLATTMMGMQIGGLDLRTGAPLLHTVLALAVMGGMLFVAVGATLAWSRKDAELGVAMARFVIAPWALWVAVFVWGVIDRGSQRL